LTGKFFSLENDTEINLLYTDHKHEFCVLQHRFSYILKFVIIYY